MTMTLKIAKQSFRIPPTYNNVSPYHVWLKRHSAVLKITSKSRFIERFRTDLHLAHRKALFSEDNLA